MNTSFYFLWSSISLGKLALSLYTMTLTVTIFSLTGSATFASFIMLVYVLGKMISTFVFPFITEKSPLNRILSSSLLIQTIFIALTLAAAMYAGKHTAGLVLIYVLIGLTGFTDGFVSPSRLSLVPETVSKEKIGRANSLINTADQTFAMLGWSLGAVAIGYYGFEPVLIASIALLTLSLLSSIPLKTRTITGIEKRPKMEVIKEGWSILFSPINKMRTLTTMDVLEGIASGIWIGGISLVFVNEVLGKGEEWWGYINTAYYAGSILGGILMAFFASKIEPHLIRGIITGSLFVCILVLLYAMNQTAWSALMLVVLMGPFYQLRDVSQQTYIQQVTSAQTLSKMYAAKDNLYYIVFALSVFITGVISDTIGVIYVYYFAFLLYLASTIFALIAFRFSKPEKAMQC